MLKNKPFLGMYTILFIGDLAFKRHFGQKKARLKRAFSDITSI